MRLLALVGLTASAAWIAPAAAQTVPDSDPYYGTSPRPDMPPPPHRPAPPAGTTWHAPAPQMQMQMHAPMAPQQMGAMPPHAMQHQTFVVHRMSPATGSERRHVEYRHVERGGMVPQRWRGRQVEVRNWRGYGFPEPFEGGRWIRYYDDALLIDGDGRVHDSRPGWDWDRYGERWDEDGAGVPVYANDGDYQRGRRDHEWAERYHRGEAGSGRHVEERVYVEHPPMGPPPCMRSCGGGYGYGSAYMGYGPVLVSETTVTEAPVVEQRTWVSYETVRVPVRHHRHVVRRCTCRVAAPPPYGGERG